VVKIRKGLSFGLTELLAMMLFLIFIAVVLPMVLGMATTTSEGVGQCPIPRQYANRFVNLMGGQVELC